MRAIVFMVAVAVLVFSTPAWTLPCTDSVDYYCDQVLWGNLFNPNLIRCEDFESANYYQDTGPGGNPLYKEGSVGDRGGASEWRNNYGPAEFDCLFSGGEPSPPGWG